MQRIQAMVFDSLTEEEFAQMEQASCMQEKSFVKGERIFHTGDVTQTLGIVRSGSVLVQNEDLWGNTSVLNKVEAGGVFAETYALCQRPMMVEVIAVKDSRIVFLNLAVALHERYQQTSWQQKMLKNLLVISARKNLSLSDRIFCTSSKSVRGRILAYLSQEIVRTGQREFQIPFNRQQMADYLNVDRSALSKELGRMRDEGLIDFQKDRFIVKGPSSWQ